MKGNKLVIVRFAPSPTGRLHIGNLRTCVLNWMYSLRYNGKFILRFDDTDLNRSSEEYTNLIKHDIKWLGLTPDKICHQSQYINEYKETMDHLISIGKIYPCYETQEELEIKRQMQLKKRMPPVYDREALKLTEEDKRRYIDQNRKPYWRFKLDNRRVTFNDGMAGNISIDCSSLSDPVIMRKDGTFLYTLCSVIDDIRENISHIIRGNDHSTNTAIQIQLFQTLGHTPPDFFHHSLLLNEEGKPFSKRDMDINVCLFQDNEIEPTALVSFLASLGTPHAPVLSWQFSDIAEKFDPCEFSSSPVKCNTRDVQNISEKLIHIMPFSQVRNKITELLADTDSNNQFYEQIWEAVHKNISHISDIKTWCLIFSGELPAEYIANDHDEVHFIQEALRTLPPLPWTKDTWCTWTAHMKQITSRKGRQLFIPLRKLLTGMTTGPEMFSLMPLYKKYSAPVIILNE